MCIKYEIIMINKDFDVLKKWMFGSLSSLLDNIPFNPNLKVLKMSIGEPQLGPPKFIRNQFDDFFDEWGKYPPSDPIPVLRDAIRIYLNKRFPGSEKIINFNENIKENQNIMFLDSDRLHHFEKEIVGSIKKEWNLCLLEKGFNKVSVYKLINIKKECNV